MGAVSRRSGCTLVLASTLAAIVDAAAQGAAIREATSVPVFNAATARTPLMLGDSVVVWFDHDAAAVTRVRIGSARTATIGRLGRGPMEFSRVSGLVRWLGDSVAVYDLETRRLTVLSSATLAGRSFQLSTIPGLGDDQVVGVMNGARLVSRTVVKNTQAGPVGAFQGDQSLRVIDLRSGLEIGRVPVKGSWTIRAANKDMAMIGGSPNPNYAISGVAASRFVVTSEYRDTVIIVDNTGHPKQALGLRIPRITLTRAERDKQHADFMTRFKGAKPDLLKQYERFAVVPPTRSRLMGFWPTDSSMWIVLEQPESQRKGNLLVEIDDEGSVRRCQPIDAGWRVTAVGSRTMLVTRFDPEEEEHFNVYAKGIAIGCAVGTLPALFR